MLVRMMIFVVGEGAGCDVMTDEDSAPHAEASVTTAQVTAVARASVCRHVTRQLISRILGKIHSSPCWFVVLRWYENVCV